MTMMMNRMFGRRHCNFRNPQAPIMPLHVL
jgi:hypothetical protein